MKKLNANLIFLIAICSLIFIYQHQTYKSYIKVVAKVTKLTKHETSSANNPTKRYTYNKPVIEFITDNGETVTYVPVINYRDDWKKGEKINLLYDPRNPKTNTVVDIFFLKHLLICIIAVLYLIYYIFIGIPLRKLKKKKEAKPKFADANI